MGILTYIFIDSIPFVDSVFIARNAVNRYLDKLNDPSFELDKTQFVLGVLALMTTQLLILARERYVRFRDAINSNFFIVNWNMTLVRRIDRQILVLEHNIPVIKSLINDDEMPKIHEKPVIIEFDLERVLNLKLNEVNDIFVNYRSFKGDSKDNVLQLSNQQFGNYVTLKNSIEQYKAITKKDHDNVFIELNKSMLDFSNKLLNFVKDNEGRLAGGQEIMKLFPEYEQKKSNPEVNGRRLENEFTKTITRILGKEYATMYNLKEFDILFTTANNIQLQYYHFFRLLENRLRSVTILHEFLNRVRKHICEIQINQLENELNLVYSFFYWGYDNKVEKYREELKKLIDEGLEKMKKQMEVEDNEGKPEEAVNNDQSEQPINGVKFKPEIKPESTAENL